MDRSERKLEVTFTGEGKLVPEAGRARRLTVRRHLDFADRAEAQEHFSRWPEPMLDAALRETGEGVSVRTAEVRFALVRSEDGRAFRVFRESLEARTLETQDILLVLTLRHVGAEGVESQSVVFAERVAPVDGVHVGGRLESDWIALGTTAGPYSLRVSAFEREEVNALLGKLGETGESILGLVQKVRKAGLL